MEFDSNDIQDDDVNEISEQNPSEKEKETETSSLSSKSGSQKYQGYNLKGKQTRICNILDKNGKRCGKLQNTKITEFARSYQPHSKHIQKQREESVLK
ncbi:hypothetical protein RhiirC2_796056 [Rhizophagus irregularis]|uniref:Uncharacterized protein n=1 Tax=Rhizophagus irregularis TaxID=588596 RepID=A0A2N1MAE4_9GLOM|nr:hypothetical protein RhiirC2_796056 [Rhizophagus irregularis]